jgi:serine/threonine protein kinase/tetratricopeptide (TPR) repeat protein
MALASGTQIGVYEILSRLGAGGMGEVYRARDTRLERIVALKCLPADVALNDQDKENLLREARAASALDHPNIGIIYGFEEGADHQFFIVMAYYEGETLAELICHRTPTFAEGLDLFIQIARGLAAAHERNIVHRDIKPSNIIITRDHVAKIVDFGLARVVASSSRTQTAHVAGTLYYMAPEQVLGEPISPRSDVWALGVTLVQTLTGKHPFNRENTAAMTFAILNQTPTGIDTLPVALQAIAYRALSKKPEHRYPTAKEMLADLEAVNERVSPLSAAAWSGDKTMAAGSLRDLKEFVEYASTPRWPTAPPPKPVWRRGLFVGLAAFVVVLSSLLLIPQVRERLSALLPSSRENHIAVLPFDNLGNNPADETVAEGLVESMTSELSNLSSVQHSLWVIPASVVRSRKLTDPSAAAREVGATLVIKGSIQRTGQAVRLVLDLIDARNLREIGSVNLEDRAGDIESLQNEAVSRLARLMNIKVSADELRVTGGSVAPAAYESYLKALGFMQRYDKPGNLDLALAALNNAVSADPQFALGYATLGQAYQLKFVVDQNPKWIEEASANCQRAVELDNSLPAAYVTLGRIHVDAGRYDLAIQEFQRALNLNPLDADALNGVAITYEKAGRTQDAEAALQKAVALRNDYWDSYNALGLFYDRQGKYAEAVKEFQHAIELTPDNAQVYSNLAAVYIDMSDAKMAPLAEAALRKSIELSPSYAAYANLGMLYSQEKRYPESAAMTEKALALNDKNYEVWENLAVAYERLQQTDKAAAARARELALVQADARTQPKNGELQSYLGLLYAKKHLPQEAVAHLQTALALRGDDQVVLENVAEAYEDLGQRPEALRYIQKALDKGYPAEDVKTNPAFASLLVDPKFRFKQKQ